MNDEFYANSVVKELGRKLNLSLSLNKGGARLIDHDGGTWCIEAQSMSTFLLVFSRIERGREDVEVYNKWLVQNSRSYKLQGAFISYDKRTNDFCLNYLISVRDLSCELIESTLIRLMNIKKGLVLEE